MPRIKKTQDGFRSKFESNIWSGVEKSGTTYESVKIKYTVPATTHTYTPDFILPNGIIVEAKGRLTLADRKKMVLVKTNNPELDIRFVFQRASNYICKGSSTTYSQWAEKNGFPWAEKQIPIEWIQEKTA